MMKCLACGKEGTKKEILLTEDKQPYCANPFTCNEYHPNSVQNIVERAGAVKMFTEDELEENIFDKLDVSDEMKERIMKIATKPQSIRLTKLEIAHYLIALQDQREDINSISEAVRYCVNVAMEVSPLQPTTKPDIPLVTERVPADIVVEEPVIKFTVPDIPKSVNVDWNKVEKVEEPKPEVNEEEEEFTF